MPQTIVPENVFSATYSGISVWEFVVNNVSVMRRKDDSWLNATQLLKVANVDKARRTKILEREWAIDSHHEKVQGGYGKYQGTWIPYERALQLCQQYNITHMVAPLLDFDPGTMTARPKPPNYASRALDRESSSASAAFNPNDSSNRRQSSRFGRFEPAINNEGEMTTLMEPSPPPLPPPGSIAHSSFLFGGQHAPHGIYDAATAAIMPNIPGNFPMGMLPSRYDTPGTNPQIGSGTYRASEDGESSVDASPHIYNSRGSDPDDQNPYPPYSFYHSYPEEMLSVPSNKIPHLSMSTIDPSTGAPVSPLSAHFELATAYASRAPSMSASSTPKVITVNCSSSISLPSIPEGPTAYRNQWMAVFLAGSDAQAAMLCQLADKTDVSRAMDSEGNTPMHWAVALGRVQVLKVLVSHGASPLAVNKTGETPLMRAMSTSHNADAQTLPMILQACAPSFAVVSQVDCTGQSVLHHLVRGASDTARGMALASAVYYARELVNYLVQSLDAKREALIQLAHITDKDGRKAVEMASFARHHDLVTQLLRLDPSMTIRHHPGHLNASFMVSASCAAAVSGFGQTIGSPLVSAGVDTTMMVPAAAVADRAAGMSE